MRSRKLKEISLTLKCECGHPMASHAYFREKCGGMHGDDECTCPEFRAVAGRRGLTHAAQLRSPKLTICRRAGIHPEYYSRLFSRHFVPGLQSRGIED